MTRRQEHDPSAMTNFEEQRCGEGEGWPRVQTWCLIMGEQTELYGIPFSIDIH